MNLFSQDNIYRQGKWFDSPGSQVYLYRQLRLLAAGQSLEDKSASPSYGEARQLANQLGYDEPEQLTRLFDDLSFGTLGLEINHEWLRATLTRSQSSWDKRTSELACEPLRGLIDGVLGSITGLPVATKETSCLAKGDSMCCFEASREDHEGKPAYVPKTPLTSERPGLNQEPPAGESGNGMIRAWYVDAINRELARSRRHERPLSLLFIDLDDLGEINATLGPPAGDQVIKAAASALSRSCRVEDYLWHHGEDEFIVALAETDSGSAESVAKRLTTEIQSSAERVDVAATVSASIGFSTFPIHAESLTGLMTSARSALYLAKSKGKGRAQMAWREDELNTKVKDQESEQAGEESSEWPAYHPVKKTEVEDEATEPVTEDTAFTAPVAQDESVREVHPSPIEEPKIPVIEEVGEEMITAIIAASGPLLLTGMREVLASDKEISVIGEVKSPDRLPDIVADLKPDVIFTDMQTVAANKFSVLKRIKEESIPSRIAIFVPEIDANVITAAADYNADGVILQNSTPQHVLTSLRAICDGIKVLPEEVQSAVDELESSRQLLNELSERELEVLRLVAEGKSNAQISEDLFITVNTVRFHLANIYQKLNVANRTEAANYYLMQGLNGEEQPKNQ